ncbi:hypothetical protein ACFX1X_004018 [Malus domestica]
MWLHLKTLLLAGFEILEIILTKGNCDDRFSTNQLASSPPFFCRSSPSRASNPVIQDEHFDNSSNKGEEVEVVDDRFGEGGV